MTGREKVKIAYPDITDEQYNDFDEKFKELCGICETDFVSTYQMIDYLQKLNIIGEYASKAGERLSKIIKESS